VDKAKHQGQQDAASVEELVGWRRSDIEFKLSSERANDPEGHYIRQWVPELRSAMCAHAPWTMTEADMEKCGCVVGRDYPKSLMGPLDLTASADEEGEEDNESPDDRDAERRVHPKDRSGHAYTKKEFEDFARSLSEPDWYAEEMWEQSIPVTKMQETIKDLQVQLAAKKAELSALRGA
jgi:hypothetical protein